MHAGTITVEELHEALKSSNTKSKMPPGDIEAVMANIDMNASGAIDYEEFLAATLHASQVSSDEHLARAFAELDHDGSGARLRMTSSARAPCFIDWLALMCPCSRKACSTSMRPCRSHHSSLW